MPRTLLMRTISRSPRIMLHLLFEPRDCWTGIFWRPRKGKLDMYICLLPMLPVKLSIGLPPRHIRRLRWWSGVARRKTRIKTERWHTFDRDIPVGRGRFGIALLLRDRRQTWETDIPRWYSEAWRWQDKPRGSGKRGWTMRGWFGVGEWRLRWIAYWTRPDTVDHVWTRTRGRQ